MLLWVVALGLAAVAGLLSWRSRWEARRLARAWDALARAFMLGFDPGSPSIRGTYRLLRLELTARRILLGLGPWRTRISARFEGVVPEGLTLRAPHGTLRASARTPDTVGRWLDEHGRRALLPLLLRGGVHVRGHTVTLETPGLLTDAEALRALLGQLAELARLLSLR